MKRLLYVLLVAVFMASAGWAQAEPVSESKNYRVFLSELPPLNKAYRHYPPTALKRNVSGMGEIECRWTIDGRLTECRVLREAPEGYRFGEATAEIFEKYARVDVHATQNQPVVPETTKLRFNWILE